ncbi:Hypothetical protein SMAX5B_014656 [Scophthalmus maximus]|uniref:Uncharacterized protein n=1 Tax=Scophthalmus maximus TaxID=52904 RepID=A0A2U9C3X7_SCOMX|nr:Hypothetical protein SMAX5B_014656 [Scophthalmus maximus]
MISLNSLSVCAKQRFPSSTLTLGRACLVAGPVDGRCFPFNVEQRGQERAGVGRGSAKGRGEARAELLVCAAMPGRSPRVSAVLNREPELRVMYGRQREAILRTDF